MQVEVGDPAHLRPAAAAAARRGRRRLLERAQQRHQRRRLSRGPLRRARAPRAVRVDRIGVPALDVLVPAEEKTCRIKDRVPSQRRVTVRMPHGDGFVPPRAHARRDQDVKRLRERESAFEQERPTDDQRECVRTRETDRGPNGIRASNKRRPHHATDDDDSQASNKRHTRHAKEGRASLYARAAVRAKSSAPWTPDFS